MKLEIDKEEKSEIFWKGFWWGVCVCSLTVVISFIIADYISLF